METSHRLMEEFECRACGELDTLINYHDGGACEVCLGFHDCDSTKWEDKCMDWIETFDEKEHLLVRCPTCGWVTVRGILGA